MPYVWADAHKSEFLGWEVRSNCTLAKTSQLGSNCMRIRSAASGDADMQQTGSRDYWVVVTGSTQYTVRCDVLAAATGRTVELWVSQWNVGPSGAFITEGSIASVTDSTSGWTQLAGSITVNASCRRLRIRIIVKSTGAANEDHYVRWVAVNTGTTTTMPAQFFKYVATRGSRNANTGTGDAVVDMPNIGGATIGNYLVAFVAVDNSGTNGAAPGLALSDPRNGSWTVGTAANNDPGAASAGMSAYFCYVKITAAMVNGDDATFDYTTGTPRSVIQIYEVEGLHPTSPVAQAQTTATSTTTTVTISRTPTAAGQVVFAMTALENFFSVFGAHDADTTDGNWEAIAGGGEANTGTAGTSVALMAAYKIVTGTTAQSWDNTLTGSADTASVAIVFALGPWPEAPTGASTPTGAQTRQTNKVPSGGSTPTGAFDALVAKVLAGAGTPAGAFDVVVSKPLTAGATPAGALTAELLSPEVDEVDVAGHFPYSRSMGTDWDDQWEVRQHCIVAPDFTVGSRPRGGSARFEADQASAYMQGQLSDPLRVQVTPGSTITLAADFLAATTARNCSFAIGQYDAAGVFIADQSGSGASDSTSAWTRISDDFTVHADCHSVRPIVRIGAPGSAALGEVHWVAALVVNPGPTNTTFVDVGAFTLEAEKSTAGGSTPTGTVATSLAKALGGTVTPTGTQTRLVTKQLAGGVTPVGLLVRESGDVVTPVGLIAPTGELTRRTDKATAGAAASSGTQTRLVTKTLGGGVTPTGEVDADFESGSQEHQQDVGGTIATQGSASLLDITSGGGSTGPTGAGSKLTAKALTGGATPSGALTSASLRTATLSGTQGSTGALSKLAAKQLASTVTSSGLLGKLAALALEATVAAAGTLSRLVELARTGTVGPSGALGRLVGKSTAATVSPAGDDTKLVGFNLEGGVLPAGTLATQSGSNVSFTATQQSSAELHVLVLKALTATTSPTGADTKLVGFDLQGTVAASGDTDAASLSALALDGSLLPTAAAALRVGKLLVGVISPTGDVQLVFMPGAGLGIPGEVDVTVQHTGFVAVDVDHDVELTTVRAGYVDVDVT